MRAGLILSTICCVVSLSAFLIAQQTVSLAPTTAVVKENETSHHLSLKLYEKRGESKKVLAAPTIQTFNEKPFAFIAGGEVKDVSPVLEYGTCVNGTVVENADNRLQVSLKISIGTPVNVDDPSFVAVKSRSIDVRMNLERATTKTIQIDADTFFDLHID